MGDYLVNIKIEDITILHAVIPVSGRLELKCAHTAH